MPLSRPTPDEQAACLDLSEWATATPETHPALKGLFIDESADRSRMAKALTTHDRLAILDSRAGARIRTSSWVGRVDLAGLRLEIQPKLGRAHLVRLLRYAYGLGELEIFSPTRTPVDELGFHDLIAAQLLAEVEALTRRGLAAHYVRREETLDNPKGQIDLTEVAKRGGIREARLPCLFYPRRSDWQLNRVALSGLRLAALLSRDRELVLGLHRLASRLTEHVSPVRLDAATLMRANQSVTRLTWHYRPALELIRLLYEINGASDASPGVSAPGYLFDMNVFWQAVLSRLFHDHLPSAIGHVADEQRLVDLMRYAPDGNPRRRRAPEPRPDFALICNGRPRLFLDAKYRDVWTQGHPVDWIYQLGIYAVAAPSRVAIMLYPTEDRAARAEKIEIIDPLRRNHVAVVILRPVIVSQLAQHISAVRKAHAQTAAVKFVVGLVTV